MSTPITSNSPGNPPLPLNFIAMLRQMLKSSDKVSDLIFSPGRPPQIELASKLQAVKIPGLEKLTPAHTSSIAKLIIGNHQNAPGGQAQVPKIPASSRKESSMLDMIEK